MPNNNPTPPGPFATRSDRQDDCGFTLLEILIAIVLVGILSAVAVVGIANLVSSGGRSSCAASADASAVAANEYLASYGTYPATFADMTTATGAPAPRRSVPHRSFPPAWRQAGAWWRRRAGGGWALTMTPGNAGSPATFVRHSSWRSPSLKAARPATPSGQVGVAVRSRRTTPGEPGGLRHTPGQGPVCREGSDSVLPAARSTARRRRLGTFPVMFTVTDAAGAVLSKTYSLTILPASVVCPTTIVGWKGEYYGTPDLTGAQAICCATTLASTSVRGFNRSWSRSADGQLLGGAGPER